MNNDLISREALLKDLKDMKVEGEVFTTAVNFAIEVIDNAPTVEERPQGEWITHEGYDGDEYYECSVCKDAFVLMEGTPKDNNYNFCPNCGANMRKGEEE